MAIVLGEVTFDEGHVTVSEKQQEVGGRDAREIEISGVIVGEHSVADIEACLDEILAAAPEDGCEAELSLRAGRRLLVRRTGFSREVGRGSLVGSFVLTLAADDPFEESSTLSFDAWSVTASGDAHDVGCGGNAATPVRITLVASGPVVTPSFTDGSRAICYGGTVANGETLILDGASGVVTLAGADVTPYASGVFPRLRPDETTLTYMDDVSSSHAAAVTVAWRNRWY